jgi:hypothetical protein
LGWVADSCQCREPPKAVTGSQHLQGSATQSQSIIEIGGYWTYARCSATIRMVAALPRLRCSQVPTRCLI